MRIHLLSDLHCDVHQEWPLLPDVAADVVVLAGDIAEGHALAQTVAWAAAQADRLGIPVLYVSGNHEYYPSSQFDQQFMQHPDYLACANLHYLQQDFIDIQGYRFFGTTLWTDFALYQSTEYSQQLAQSYMLDYQAIDAKQGGISPQKVAAWHWQQRQWLQQQLQQAQQNHMPTVVISHHGCSMQSVATRYLGSGLNPSFVSDLSEWFVQNWAPKLWLHGHTHELIDYQINHTRVVTNPRGYPHEVDQRGEVNWYRVLELPPIAPPAV